MKYLPEIVPLYCRRLELEICHPVCISSKVSRIFSSHANSNNNETAETATSGEMSEKKN